MSNWSVPKDENGKAYYSYRKVTYWVNSTENYKYIIKGELAYRPDIIEDLPVPVSSEFTDWKTGITYIMRNDGWNVLPKPGGGGGGDITRDEVIAFDAEVLRQSKLYTDRMITVVNADENQTINSYSVPKLTKDDLQALFNANQNGHIAIVRDADSDNIYIVKQSALNDDDSQSVLFDYKGVMILDYNVKSGSDEVTTSYTAIGGAGSVIIEVDENQTINGYQVPKLTSDDLMRAYNGIVAGYQVIVVDSTGNYNFAVKQADTDTEDNFVCFDFCGVMVLTYKLHDEEVTTEYTLIGGGGEPTHYLKAINKTETESATDVSISNESDVTTTFSIPKEIGRGWKYIDQLNKVEDYLYQAKLKTHDYDFANDYFKSAEAEVPAGSCTTISRDGLFGRNYDWLYDNSVEFIYNTDYVANVRRSSIAMISGASQFSKAYIESGNYTDNIKLLPFYTTDGVNDAGVRVSTHVLNNAGYGTDDGVINPTDTEERELASLMLPRFILDTFTSANNAVNYIMQNVKVYHPQPLIDMGYLQTFTIADDTHTYILEPWNHEFKLVTDKTPIVTNFEWWHTTTNEDGTLWTNVDIDHGKRPGDQTNNQHKAMGVERYNLALSSIKDIATLDISSLKATMKTLNYTRMYDSHPNPPEAAWLSDYITSTNSLTATGTHASAFESDRRIEDIAYQNRTRETAKTWQTVHSSIYDWANKKLYLSVQEQDGWYEFDIPWYQGDIATVDYVNAQDEVTLAAAKSYTDTEVAKKSPIVDAGDNITVETVPGTGHIKINSTATGGDITKAEVEAMIAEALATAQGYANTAKLEAEGYTDNQIRGIDTRLAPIESWKDSTKYEDLDYVLDDDSTITISHIVDKSSE